MRRIRHGSFSIKILYAPLLPVLGIANVALNANASVRQTRNARAPEGAPQPSRRRLCGHARYGVARHVGRDPS